MTEQKNKQITDHGHKIGVDVDDLDAEVVGEGFHNLFGFIAPRLSD